jgi:hypothetical protein
MAGVPVADRPNVGQQRDPGLKGPCRSRRCAHPRDTDSRASFMAFRIWPFATRVERRVRRSGSRRAAGPFRALVTGIAGLIMAAVPPINGNRYGRRTPRSQRSS